MEAPAQQEMNQEQLGNWVREQFQKANKFLAENEVLFESVVTQESSYLAPFIAVWKIKDVKGRFFWVISGDVSTDFIRSSAAESARAAIKYFSLQWQGKAENIRQTALGNSEQITIANRLEKDAEDLYEVASNARLWPES
jgi:hypothetical protein